MYSITILYKIQSIVRSSIFASTLGRAPCLPWTLACLLLLHAWSNLAAQQQPRLTHGWELEPALGASWIPMAPRAVVKLEPVQFSSAEREIRLAAAQQAIRHASEPTLLGREASLQSILSQLKTTDESQLVQLSLASAAIKLGDASHAAVLWERLRHDVATRHLIEQALISWRSPVALDVWRERLTQENPDNSELILAIEGIAAVGSTQDLVALEALLRSDRTSTPLKLVLARSMGSLSAQGLEEFSGHVTASGIKQHELIVAELLNNHSSEQARRQLVEILQSPNTTARYRAYSTLSDNFGPLARELAPEMLALRHSKLREKAIEVLNRHNDPDSLREQAKAISDPNQAIRNIVRANLQQKARLAELRPVVDDVITLQLKSGPPQSIVQVILLLVALQERERSPQLFELLDAPDLDTRLTAAWSLQALVDSPELLAAIFEKTEQLTRRLQNKDGVTFAEILQQSYLFEALGRNRYQPALESLKLYIPKDGHKMGDVARASAIWALARIIEGSQDARIAKQLAQRMLDQSDDDPEESLVQFTSAIALGWIGAPDSVAELKKISGEPTAPIVLARDWSLKRLSPQN
jgi:hypothetical protein